MLRLDCVRAWNHSCFGLIKFSTHLRQSLIMKSSYHLQMMLEDIISNLSFLSASPCAQEDLHPS